MNLIETSKFLSYVLRHRPDAIGIQLDKNGWVAIDVLLNALNKHEHKINREQLTQIVETNEKKRYTISDDKLCIRANQGHSIKVDLQLTHREPPEFLYHGTVERFIASILKNGLIKGERHHVHLSSDIETAIKVGSRRGEAIVLRISAKEMTSDGYKFYKSENGVWLTDFVPVKYLNRN